jgi:cobalt/nickel transport system permease protein
MTNSVLVPIITFLMGICLMAYSTNFKIPLLVALAIGEAILIMIIGCGMISILGNQSQPALWETNILWFHIYMTEVSFNQAWLVFFRAIAGVTLMMSLATSTPIPHFAYALRQIKIPKEIVEIIVLIYRYSFLLLERMEVMWNAAQCRLGFNGFVNKFKTTAGIAVGIFTTSMEMGDRAQGALECRNYKGYFPIFRMPGKTGISWILMSAVICVLLFLIGNHTLGWVDFAELFFGSGVI